MGVPFYDPLSPMNTRPMSSTARDRSSDVPSSCDAATKTARLVEDFKQHAAEWAAADATYSRGEYRQPHLVTAVAVEGGTEAAFARWRAATANDHVGQTDSRH